MSNKKLGGIRLRLIIGMMAVLAIFGAVLAFAPRKFDPTLVVNPDSATGGLAFGYVELSGLNDGTTYWVVPTQSGNPAYTGLVQAASQPSFPFTNGFVFRTSPTPDAIQINGTGADANSSSGSVTLPLQTGMVGSNQVLIVQLRADNSGQPTGSVLSSDDLTILTQD